MWAPRLLWLCLLLAPPVTWAQKRIVIKTTVNAHYAITTVKADFSTGPVEEDLTFNLSFQPDSFVSGFSITADGFECEASVEEINEAKDKFNDAIAQGDTAGYTKIYYDDYAQAQTFETEVRLKKNTTGFFLLTFEHQVEKDEDDTQKPYKLYIPVLRSQHYDRWTVEMDILEDNNIDTVQQDVEFYDYNSGKNLSDMFKKNVVARVRNHNTFYFDATIPEEEETSYIQGYFQLKYTIDPGMKQMETFVSEDQVAALINPNPALNPNPGLDILILLDTSGSMEKKDKLNITLDAVVGTLLKGLKEEDQVTFIQFHTSVLDLGTFTGGRKDRRDARKKLARVKAEGWTDISGALDKALEVAESHIQGGSTEAPLIVMYTDGKPEGGNTAIVSDTERIKRNVRSKNQRGIPIYSVAIGDGADSTFVRDLSQENFGNAYDFDTDTYLIDNLEDIFEQVRVPIYSNKPEISIKSDCVDETKFKSDLTALFGKKFANTSELDLINIPFKSSVPLTLACEVEITYTAIVGNKPVKEEIKLCFPEGRRAGRKFQKLSDLSTPCCRRTGGPPAKIPQGKFLERLREYRDISESVKTGSESRQSLVARAKDANFVVEYITALVTVVQSENSQCRPLERREEQPFYNSEPYFPPTIPAPFLCGLKACDKSRFRGHCVNIYDKSFPKLRSEDDEYTDYTNYMAPFGLGPDEIASLNITSGELGVCPGYVLYTDENYTGDSITFGPGEFPGFRELGILFQEARSLKPI